MKYIKTYEDKKWYLDAGDYVTFNINIVDSSNGNIVIRKDRPYMIINLNDGYPHVICDDGRTSGIHRDGVKKISKEKALILLDAEKYNL